MESIMNSAVENVKPVNVKRPLSAYMLFSADERQKMKCMEGPKMSFTEATKYISKRWSEIDQDGKQKYANLAELDRERYRQELAAAGMTGSGKRKRVGKKMKSRKHPKLIGGPKKAMSSFLLFCHDKRPEVRAELGEASVNIAVVGKRLGQMWQEESPEEKQRYKDLAELEKKRYDRELEEFMRSQQEIEIAVPDMDSD